MISAFGLVRFLKIRHFWFRFGSVFDFFGSVNHSSPIVHCSIEESKRTKRKLDEVSRSSILAVPVFWPHPCNIVISRRPLGE